MLNRKFDPNKPLRVVSYLRMSTDKQNPRSPDQQKDTIEATYKRLGYPWVFIGDYRDNGVSGRYIKKRRGFQKMLLDINTGAIQVDAILVDTFERFGRNEDLESIRRNLDKRFGVLVLTADTNFSDPTSPTGKVIGMLENFRAIESNRIKKHDVNRGKIDAVYQGQWPGAEAPFGYKLEPVFVAGKNGQELAYRKLVPNPEKAWIIKKIFDMAGEQGLGCSKIARMLNHDLDIPQDCKPFYESTVNHWLKKELYYGEMVWGKKSTDVCDDRRVSKSNPESELIRIPDFCEPLISKELWEKAREVRQFRSNRTKNALKEKREKGGKIIEPMSQGYALTYPLTGLVRCSICKRSMNISVSQAYTTKSGEEKRYPSYYCIGYLSRYCSNGTRIPEEWLVDRIMDLIKRRLFQIGNGDSSSLSWTVSDLEKCPWVQDLMEQVRKEFQRLQTSNQEGRPNYENELSQINRQIQGWALTLANPDLDILFRRSIERESSKAINRQQEIQNILDSVDAIRKYEEEMIDPQKVVDCLNRLGEVLRKASPSRLNMELAMHIDSIRCDQEGRVTVRTFKLGSLAEVRSHLPQVENSPSKQSPEDPNIIQATPRRLGLRRIDDCGDNSELEDMAHFSADVYRFSGFGEEWFWEDVFQVEPKIHWYQEFAYKVADMKMETGLSPAKLAKQFGKSRPTIERALKYAAENPRPVNQGDFIF